MASHEFRTPLTVIDGHARRLMKTKDTVAPAEIDERGGKIRAAVLRLIHLIDNLLNSGRLIDGGAELYFHPAALDLRALLREVCQLHREMVPVARIVERFPGGPLPARRRRQAAVSGLQQSLVQRRQVFAERRRHRGRGRQPAGAAGEVVIAVTDHGIGIPAGDIERLFERYHRGSNVSGIVGTGVGLYLVKMAVERHGGRVEVTSTEGAGSRFSVHLPAMRKVARAGAPLGGRRCRLVRRGADLRSRRDFSGVVAGR